MSVLIDPPNMSLSEQRILSRLIEHHHSPQFYALEPYTIEINEVVTEIQLTCDLFFYKTVKKNQPRYAVIPTNEALGEGTFGAVYNVVGVLTPPNYSCYAH